VPQARDSHIPSSGQNIPVVARKQTYATTTKPQAPEKPAKVRGRAKRRIIFLIGIAVFLFGVLLIWVGLSSVNAAPMAIASFGVIPGSENLYATFQLANSEGGLVSAAGGGTIELYDGLGNLLDRQQISFAKKDFDRSSKAFSMTIPKTKLDLKGSVNRGETFAAAVTKAGTALSHGRAILTVAVNSNENALTAVRSDIQFYSVEEAASIARRIYYGEAVQALEEEINKQWPFAVKISDYAMIGDRGWIVVGRTGGEIIFYPYGEIYDWYLLESKDSGKSWDIIWGGDTAPLFRVEFVDASGVKVTTASDIFYTPDGGRTWQSS
jgi:hypothetical protein